MITFAEKYQKVWESEAKATLALGAFLGGRAESMRYQVELMRMGSEAFPPPGSDRVFGLKKTV